jgi:hypothetical protein
MPYSTAWYHMRQLQISNYFACTCHPHAHPQPPTPQVLGDRSVPCPTLNIAAGFQAYFDAAVKMVSNPPFDPFKKDVNFLLATWSLEEIGATGDKVLPTTGASIQCQCQSQHAVAALVRQNLEGLYPRSVTHQLYLNGVHSSSTARLPRLSATVAASWQTPAPTSLSPCPPTPLSPGLLTPTPTTPLPHPQGCILLASNPGVSNCIAGLAGAASYQSGVDRHFLWQRRNETVPEYNMTVHQVGMQGSGTKLCLSLSRRQLLQGINLGCMWLFV